MKVVKKICAGAAAAVLLHGGAAAQDTIRGGGQVVEVRAETAGDGTTVCLETAPNVAGRKRALISHAGGTVSVSTTATDHGPNCAHVPAGGEVTVRLEYLRLMVFPTQLTARTFRPAEARGKTITFRWVKD